MLRLQQEMALLEIQYSNQAQHQDLERQKLDKKKLLAETQNNERIYQDRLAKALAEYNAIKTVCSGGGAESEVRTVKTGDTIASIIPGWMTDVGGMSTILIVVLVHIMYKPKAQTI